MVSAWPQCTSTQCPMISIRWFWVSKRVVGECWLAILSIYGHGPIILGTLGDLDCRDPVGEIMLRYV